MRFLLALALLIAAVMLYTHLYDEIAWKRHYERATIISDCEYGVAKWPGSFEAAFASPPELKSGVMPYRGQGQDIRTPVGSYLYTRCRIPTSGQTQVFSTGKLYGASQIRIDGELRGAIGEVGEVVLNLVDSGSDGHVFELVSRGDESEIVGLATLIPLYATSDPSVHQAIQRYRLASATEQPAFRIGMSLAVLLLIFFVWFYGMRYQDLFWLAVLLSAVCLENFIDYFQYMLPAWQGWLARAEGAAVTTTLVAVFLLLVSILRTARLPNLIVVLCWLGLVVITFSVPDDLFFDLRLQGELQSYLVAIASGGLALYLWIRLSTKNLYELEMKRYRYVAVLATATGAILLVQAYFEQAQAIYLAPIVQAGMAISFTGITLRDLVRRQREWKAERQRRHQLEDANSRQRARIEVGNMLAHDIMRPLEMVSLLPDRPSEAQLANAKLAGQQALSLLENLTFLDAKTKINPSATDIDLLLSSAWSIVESKDKEKARSLEFRKEGFEGRILNVDPLAFSRICQNLLGNAFDLCPLQQSITVSFQVNADSIELVFHNTGTFIRDEDRAQVFKRFWTGRSSKGLGLAIVRELVEAHGGRVGCESSEKDGTRFELLFPQEVLLERTSVDDDGIAQLRVAVVDDDDIILTAWEVARGSSDTLTFNTPELFLDALADGQLEGADVVLMDLNFGNSRIGGEELVRRLWEALPNLPVFLTSIGAMDNPTPNVLGRIGKNPRNWPQVIDRLRRS